MNISPRTHRHAPIEMTYRRWRGRAHRGVPISFTDARHVEDVERIVRRS
jgi:hypothetical protein